MADNLKIRDQIIWLAGLIEGEGCFTYTLQNGPRVSIKMVDEDTIIKISAIWKAPYHKINKQKSTWQDSYMISIYGSKAIQWMLSIYSLMSIRRKNKIRSIVQQWKNTKIKKTIDYNIKNAIIEDYKSNNFFKKELAKKYNVHRHTISRILKMEKLIYGR